MKNIPIRLLLVLLGIVLLCIYIWLSTKPGAEAEKAGRGHRVFSVKMAKPVIKTIPLTVEELGSVEAEQTVDVIPQTTGVLKKIGFIPGQEVKQGQILFEIEAGISAANWEQAKANLARDSAQLSLLQSTADRYAALARLEYVTQQQYEEAKAAALAQSAVVAASSALLKQAEIQLGYTQIRAPISGKTGDVALHVGDLVTANSTPLVVIKKMDQVQVSFAISQDKLPELLKRRQQSVEILHEGSDQVLAEGRLSIINNAINSQTGMVPLKASVANPHLALWPGQLVTVRLILGVHANALVVPTSAVQLGQKGAYVYRVKQGKVVIQPVTIAQETKGEAVVTQGLQAGEEIIVEVPVGLKEGSEVKRDH